jgi:hypothetical protein
VSPDTIEPGKSAQLSWSTQNAQEVTIDGEAVSTSGSRQVSATASRKYTLVAKGPGGTNRDVASLNVKAVELPKQPGARNDSISDSDKAAIEQILNRYADIVEKRKAKSLREIWHTAPAATLSNLQSFIDSSKDLRASIVPQKWEPHGTGILVTCQQTLSYTRNGKQTSNSTINFYMVKSQGAWTISDIPVSSD